MRLTSILSTGFLLYSTCSALPRAVPVPEAQFDIQLVDGSLFERDITDMINEFVSSIDTDLIKRDQQTIESILESVNNSGIIFDLLDSISSSPDQIEGLANLTGKLLGGIDLSSINLSSLASMGSSVNLTKILSIVQDSGLINSLLDGTLLDKSFQPTLAHITERVILANEGIIAYVLNTYLQPASDNKKRAESLDFAGLISQLNTIDGSAATTLASVTSAIASRVSASASVKETTSQAASPKATTLDKSTRTSFNLASLASSAIESAASSASTKSSSAALATTSSSSSSSSSSSGDTDGSLGDFAGNLAGSLLDSEAFTDTLADILGALNDTGIAVYIVKRFLSNDAYLNMTGTLVEDIIFSSNLNVSGLTDSLNISSLIQSSLSDPDYIVGLVSDVLSGNLSSLTSGLGKYSGALTNIVGIMEDDGLFVSLNSYLFPSSTAGSGNQKDVVTSAGSSSASGSPKASSTSSAKNDANIMIPSSIVSVMLGLFLLL